MPKQRPHLQPTGSKGFLDGLATSGKVRPPSTTPPAPTLPIIFIVVVLAGGVFAAWRYLPGWLNTKRTPKTTTSSSTQVINVDLNANVVPAVIKAPAEVKGSDAFSGTATVNGVKITFSSMQRQTTWQDTKADAGQTFILLYFDAVAPADVDKVNQGFIDGAHVVRGLTTYPLQAIQVATTSVTGNRGYLKFEIPTQGKFQLEIGTGASAQRVSIP